jgi:hypothetical protein
MVTLGLCETAALLIVEWTGAVPRSLYAEAMDRDLHG